MHEEKDHAEAAHITVNAPPKRTERKAMAETYDPAYLAESRVTLVTVFYSIPIFLMILSTTLRLWAKLRAEPKRLAFDDYLMIWATVSRCRYPFWEI